MTPIGMTICPSCHGPKETMDRVAAGVTSRGIAIVTRIDHAAAAVQVGMALLPTEVIIFGKPTAGTPLMQGAQTMGIDLPLKALVWQDEAGKTWLAYNDPTWIAKRHNALAEIRSHLGTMTDTLAAIAEEAAARTKEEP